MRLKFWISLLVAGFCLYWVFKGISFESLWTTLRQASPAWIVAAGGIYLSGYLFRAMRWEVLIKPIREVQAKDLFWPMVLGFFANNILPFRMGELVRAHISGRKFHISRTASLGTILLERICDTISFLTTFLAVALFFPFPWLVEKGALALGLACILTIGALLVIHTHQKRFHAIIESIKISDKWKKNIQDIVFNFSHGISGVKQPRYALAAILLSMVVWTLEGTFLYFMAKAFATPLTYPQSFFLLFFMGLSVTLPQAPGYVGTLELFGVTALSLLGIPKEQGLPVILAIHGTQFCFISLLGCCGLWKEGLSLKNLTSTADNFA